jgi:hypothetical protein
MMEYVPSSIPEILQQKSSCCRISNVNVKIESLLIENPQRMIYSETSLNGTLRKPVLPEYRLILHVLAKYFFAKEVRLTKPATPLDQTNFLVPVQTGFEKFHCSKALCEFPLSSYF